MKHLMLLLFSVLTLPAYSTETLNVSDGHSAVVFTWSHFGFSHPVARLEKIEGKLILDENDLTKSSVTVTMPLEGLRTGSDSLNARLKNAEFLEVAKYPNITFNSTRVEKGPMDTLKITGDLSVHGITKSVVLDAKINKISMETAAKSSRAGFDADTVLRRSDFGVDRYVPAVTDELYVHITLEADSIE